MVASAMQLQARYAELKLPIVILAGDGEQDGRFGSPVEALSTTRRRKAS